MGTYYDSCFIVFYIVHFVGEYIECKKMHDINNIKFAEIYLKNLECFCFLFCTYGSIVAECGGDIKCQIFLFAHFEAGVL